MATTAMSALEGIYQDRVFQATELNRKHSYVLDCARKGPVTISRNNELFALLRREQAAELVHAVNLLKEVGSSTGSSDGDSQSGNFSPGAFMIGFKLSTMKIWQ